MSGVALAGSFALASFTGSGLGVLAGCSLVVWLLRRSSTRRRRSSKVASQPGPVRGHGYEQLTDNFETHARAVQRQLSEFADHLADGDPHLRARLQAFESGSGDGMNR